VCLGKGRLPRDGLRQRPNVFSAAAHLAFMFLRMICIGVNGVPIFFADFDTLRCCVSTLPKREAVYHRRQQLLPTVSDRHRSTRSHASSWYQFQHVIDFFEPRYRSIGKDQSVRLA
jgi:hypothetical protein